MKSSLVFLIAFTVLAFGEGAKLCNEGYVHCNQDTKCVQFLKLCNGKNDCPDKSDENEEMCQVLKSIPRKEMCANDSLSCFNKCQSLPDVCSMKCISEVSLEKKFCSWFDVEGKLTNLKTPSDDSCSTQPCRMPNTLCHSVSPTEYKCLCAAGNLVPVNRNAKLFGCQEDPCSNEPCKMPNTFCLSMFFMTLSHHSCLCSGKNHVAVNDNAELYGCKEELTMGNEVSRQYNNGFTNYNSCLYPFEMVPGLGCLWLYHETNHTYDKGMTQCRSKGGEMWEPKGSFDEEWELMIPFMDAKGVSYTNANDDNVWISAKRTAFEGNFIFPRSRKILNHEEPNRSQFWKYGLPNEENTLQCVFYNHIMKTIWDWHCSADMMQMIDWTICEKS